MRRRLGDHFKQMMEFPGRAELIRVRVYRRAKRRDRLDYVAKHIMGIMQRTGGLAHSPDAATEAIRSNRI